MKSEIEHLYTVHRNLYNSTLEFANVNKELQYEYDSRYETNRTDAKTVGVTKVVLRRDTCRRRKFSTEVFPGVRHMSLQ